MKEPVWVKKFFVPNHMIKVSYPICLKLFFLCVCILYMYRNPTNSGMVV